IFRHLNFNCLVARLHRESIGVDGLCSLAAPAVTTEPFARSNKHELRTSSESPVALGRDEADEKFVPSLERILRPAIRKRVSGTYGFDAPGLLFAFIVLQRKVNLDVGILKYVSRHGRLRRDANREVID